MPDQKTNPDRRQQLENAIVHLRGKRVEMKNALDAIENEIATKEAALAKLPAPNKQ